MLSTEQVRALARQLIEAEPLLHRAAPAEFAARLGWRVCDDTRYEGVVRTDAGLGVGGCSADLDLDNQGGVKRLSLPICDLAKPRTVESVALCRDAFALGTRALTEEFGAPTDREYGGKPRVGWRLDAVTLTLALGPVSTRLAMARNSDLDEWKERAANEQ